MRPPRSGVCSRSGRPDQVNRRTVAPSASATATYVSPTGFCGVPPSGPAIPVTDTARCAPVRSRPPMAMAIATWAETAPWAARMSSPTPTDCALLVVRVGHEAAEVVRARARDLGDEVTDETAGARLHGRHRQAVQRASLAEAGGQPGQVGERIVLHRYRRCVFSGGAGGANSQVSGTPDLPRCPSDVPLRVKYVTPDDPVRTSILSAPGERQGLAVRDDLPGGAEAWVDLAVDPDLDPGPTTLGGDDEVDALVQDRDVPGQGGRLALRARRGHGDRPATGGQLERRAVRRRRRRPSRGPAAASRVVPAWRRPYPAAARTARRRPR